MSLLLAGSLGIGLMTWAGCVHMSPTALPLGVAVFLTAVGALSSSFVAGCRHCQRTRRLVEQASVVVEDDERLETVTRLAGHMGLPAPGLRAIVSDRPLALSLLGRKPIIVVSTWVFDHLSPHEWEAVVAHELAHARRTDRWVRWAGTCIRDALSRLPGCHQAWQRLDSASEAAADTAAAALLGNDAALCSARQKFVSLAGGPKEGILHQLRPRSNRQRFAVAALGAVAALPLLPLIVVPLCLRLCAP
jgi:Zn-dependent protease with chaperone function